MKGDTTNPLYAPFTQMPASIPAAEQAAMRGDAATVIRDVVAPAYERLLGFMRTVYLPKARTTLAAIATPGGEAYYQAMIDKFTTLDLTAKQIHEIGLQEVARIAAEMEATKERAGFKGTMGEFIHFLRTDPQFYAKTPRELLSYLAYVSKKADWKLEPGDWIPAAARHGIRPVPEALAPIYTGGRGGLEACLMNASNLPARPLYTLAALTLHESAPGHSFQAAPALEGPERPPFRRGTSFSGYGEGWGLYAEWLGTVMGIYETRRGLRPAHLRNVAREPARDRHGHPRLRVVSRAGDGLPAHARGAFRARDRDRGRALYRVARAGPAFKLVELQIRRHRREAEEKFGPKFDQRHFHDAILALGPEPLPVLERRMAQFIADGGVNPPAVLPR